MGQVLAVPGARPPPALTDHLVEEILVRVATPRDLIRASAACASFRRLVAAASFLRRYRSLHPPVLLGVLSPMGFLPAEVPHPNALAAYAFDHDADFSRNHLPPRQRPGWWRCDARDGRVLWQCFYSAGGLVLPELAVCDPLTREFTLLPPIPDDLVASLLGRVLDLDFDHFDAFFVPSGDYEEAHFRVIGWTHCDAMAAVFVYSSLSSAWTPGTSTTWNALGLGLVVEAILENSWWPSYVYGCFYWHVQCSNMLLKLDINRMEFSAVGLPPVRENQRLVVAVEAGEGRIGLLKHMCQQHIYSQGIPDSLCYSVRQNEGDNANGHLVETTIQLPSDYDRYSIVAAAEGYIFLLGLRFVYQQGTHMLIEGSSVFFSLDIKTLKIQRVCSTRGDLCDHVLPYFGFPPFVSPTRI